ncbi:fumarylacetoacetate hydrolase family protein [Vibrio gallicus]|uniref:fumarylacetoacetate hydrolase family protein n=1 Tax=Vibrio gallicus TaxID=190897 RepID=UPI0021C4043C|nr:fumarylacetoacetate hydrolase family protein [Vibrio gallicus]
MKWIILISTLIASASAWSEVEQFVRYQQGEEIGYGRLVSNKVYPISGDVFDQFSVESNNIALDKVELLLPVIPEKVFAVGMNFASHMSSPSDRPPPLFLKLPSSLILSGQTIQVPSDAKNVHFEGELVVVIGKEARNISEDQVKGVVFGVTVGNDLTERSWQGQDLQWMRAKATDGFGPIAATITRGVDYEASLLTTRLNGKVVQQENTRHMIHSVAKVVSYLSRYFTLKPGDLIFMGTPGRTKALSDGDIVSVTIDGVGSVENTVQF